MPARSRPVGAFTVGPRLLPAAADRQGAAPGWSAIFLQDSRGASGLGAVGGLRSLRQTAADCPMSSSVFGWGFPSGGLGGAKGWSAVPSQRSIACVSGIASSSQTSLR
jgi:hypothetical protein